MVSYAPTVVIQPRTRGSKGQNMKPQKMSELIRLANSGAGPIGTIVGTCVRAGAVQLLELEQSLERADYKIEHEDGKNGAWARVFKDEGEGDAKVPVLKAQGYSSEGPDDALLQAVWGAAREEEAFAAVDAGLASAGIKVDEALRRKLESRYITDGGEARLKSDLQAMRQQQLKQQPSTPAASAPAQEA
jgi:hypothetical protein